MHFAAQLGHADAARKVKAFAEAAGSNVEIIVRDAVGSRRSESKETAIRGMERNGVEVMTTEMVIFEWLETTADARLHAVIQLIR